jgi:hypothetical protein
MKYIIKDFKPESGWHCITNAYKQVFHYYGHDILEEMLFGLASGLGFMYFEMKNVHFPLIGGRTKIGDFEQMIGKNLGININMQKTSSSKKAYDELKKLISQDIPVVIYVDMAFLKYLGLPKDAHFGGHTIVVFGIDEEKQIAYISDRDGRDFKVTNSKTAEPPADYHLVPLRDLEIARGSEYKPYSPENKWVTFDFTNIREIDRKLIYRAIMSNMNQILNPPIKNLGIKGVKLFSEKISGWAEFDDDKLKWSTINAYVMINQIGGNGGGIFRRMYGNFLKQSAEIINAQSLNKCGESFIQLSYEWDEIGNLFLEVFNETDRSILNEIAQRLDKIYRKEKECLEELNNEVS